MPIGQYTPQSALGRVDFGMRTASAGKNPQAELQTLAMNDQLMRKREQDMQLAAMQAQQQVQDAQAKMANAETSRLAGISTGVQDYLATNGQYLAGLITSGDTEGYKNAIHSLGQSLQASPDELAQAAPFNKPDALVGYANQAQQAAGYGYVHDEKSLSDKDVEREKSRLVGDRDRVGDLRQEQIDQRKVAASQMREDIVSMGGKFNPKDVKEVYSTGMGPDAVNESVTVARSALTKILGDADLSAKEMKNKQQGGVETDSLSFKYGVAVQKKYSEKVNADVREWNSMSPNQKLMTPGKRPKTPEEYRSAALEDVVAMTTLDGEPQAYVTKKLEADRKVFTSEMLRSPDPKVQEAVQVAQQVIANTETYQRLAQAVQSGAISAEQVGKIEAKMLEEALVKMYYGKPVIRGLVKGSEFTRNTQGNRPTGGGQMRHGR